MIEVFTMALHQSNIIINILLVSAFLLNLVLHSLLFHGGVQKFYMGVVIGFSFLPLVGFILYLLLGRQIQRTYI